jgi:enterochelin esterase-like enzyme
VLYLSHGGGGTDSDWFNDARAHNILDRLIVSGEVEPIIVITPNFYNLGFTLEQYATNTTVEDLMLV